MVAIGIPAPAFRRWSDELGGRPAADTPLDALAPLLERAKREGRLFERDIERFLESLPAPASAGMRGALLQQLLDADVLVVEGPDGRTLARTWEALFYWKKVLGYGLIVAALAGHEWWLVQLRAPLAGP